MFFDLTGAAASHAAVGDPAAKIGTPVILVAIVAASWALRSESRKLRGPFRQFFDSTNHRNCLRAGLACASAYLPYDFWASVWSRMFPERRRRA